MSAWRRCSTFCCAWMRTSFSALPQKTRTSRAHRLATARMAATSAAAAAAALLAMSLPLPLHAVAALRACFRFHFRSRSLSLASQAISSSKWSQCVRLRLTSTGRNRGSHALGSAPKVDAWARASSRTSTARSTRSSSASRCFARRAHSCAWASASSPDSSTGALACHVGGRQGAGGSRGAGAGTGAYTRAAPSYGLVEYMPRPREAEEGPAVDDGCTVTCCVHWGPSNTTFRGVGLASSGGGGWGDHMRRGGCPPGGAIGLPLRSLRPKAPAAAAPAADGGADAWAWACACGCPGTP